MGFWGFGESKTTDMMIAQDSICSGCAEGDLKALRHVASKRPKETQVGALVYSDVFGPYPVYSLNRHRYFVVFLDAASGFLATFFTRSTHSQAIRDALNDFVTLVGRGGIRALRTDNASYWHGAVRDYCRGRNIRQEFSPPYSHQSAGAAERAIGRITQLTRKLVAAANCPCEFWPYAVRMATLILNKTGNSRDPSKSPFEQFFGIRPSLSDIKVFACLAIARVPPERRTAKLLPTTVKGIYLGRNIDSNTHIVFVPYVDTETDKLKGK